MKWLILLLLAMPVAHAASGHIDLVALAESGDRKEGAVADLFLEIGPGSERVFLETFPLTKITTQGSMRFAQQIACEQVEIDCSEIDFFYTIRSPPGIVSGPSAGAAAAVLTAALITGQDIPGDVSITGTINSGGVIGPVGSIIHKINGAASKGITKLAIPLGTRMQNFNNATVDAVNYGKDLGVEVIEVSTLREALEVFGMSVPADTRSEFGISEAYAAVIAGIAEDMCGNVVSDDDQVISFIQQARVAESENKLYSAASFCFRANIAQKRIESGSWNQQEMEQRADALNQKVLIELDDVEKYSLTTLTDVQTAMAVWERLNEVKDTVANVYERLKLGQLDDARSLLAYAEERFESAKSWSNFFSTDPGRVRVTEEKLKKSCEQKLSEAQARYNFVSTYSGGILTRDNLDLGYKEQSLGRYWTCLYAASKSKAASNTVMSVLGVHEESLPKLLEVKKAAAEQAIARAQQRSVFPLLSYTYYEYASSLISSDRANALLFLEYSLELSNLEIYFDRSPALLEDASDFPSLSVFLYGIGIGIVIAVIVLAMQKQR